MKFMSQSHTEHSQKNGSQPPKNDSLLFATCSNDILWMYFFIRVWQTVD